MGKWTPTHLDHELSPYSGLTRESWIDAGKYLLSGIFRHIGSMDDPIVMPRNETEVTYPHLKDPQDWQDAQKKAEIFEGLTRSFFIASVLLKEEPDLVLEGIPVREYYKKQILSCMLPDHPHYVGTYSYLTKGSVKTDPFRCCQQTVETCALVIGLWACREQIWLTYTKQERDLIAAFLTDYAHAPTVPQNWRLFNMLDMAFLHKEGYPIRKEVMLDHAQAILDDYVGDGWYRDGHSFDYYSCWAFQFYAPLWNLWYGYEEEPEIAARFEEHSNALMKSFPMAFDRDGFTNMWGRSGIYRNAATSAFDGNFFLKNPTADPGLARRICSGSLLQFLTREDFLVNDIPSLGFYGQFMPLVQGYSCAESPFWLGKAFLCLHLPGDHPFWSARENNGIWDEMSALETRETILDGPALCYGNHQANGGTILRSGKVLKNRDDLHGMWNYGKLSYHTKYPWESTPRQVSPGPISDAWNGTQVIGQKARGECSPECAQKLREWTLQALADGSVESQQYVLRNEWDGAFSHANVTYWGGMKEQVLYRRQYFDFVLECERHWIQGMNLADFAVPYGLIRVDKLRLHKRPVTITLGSYGFPDNQTTIQAMECGRAKAIILKGYDRMGREKQMVQTLYDGWDTIGILYSRGSNPDSEKSIVLYLRAESRNLYDARQPYVLISQLITKESHEDFTQEEIFPIKEVIYADPFGTGATGPVRILLKNGEERIVDYDGLEGRLTI